jgi:tripartite-type tricarboxylate transporter receptor subunit TctC
MIHRRLVLPLAATVLAAPRIAAAQSGSGVSGWPNRPVRIVVGFPPGGLPDVYARLLADRMSPVLGQPVVVENRIGSGGIVANELVARADDGHTFLSTSISLPVGAALRQGQIGYDVLRDFAMVSMLSSVANGIFVH